MKAEILRFIFNIGLGVSHPFITLSSMMLMRLPWQSRMIMFCFMQVWSLVLVWLLNGRPADLPKTQLVLVLFASVCVCLSVV